MPFPYPKLDFLTISRSRAASARWRNAGLITMAQHYTNLDAHPSWDRPPELDSASASHEAVAPVVSAISSPPRGGDDIWLNEGLRGLARGTR